jgi:hypothetical protein
MIRVVVVAAALAWGLASSDAWSDTPDFQFSPPQGKVGYRLQERQPGLYGGAGAAKRPWEDFYDQTAALVETPLPEWAGVPRRIFLPPELQHRSLWRRLKEGFDKNIVVSGFQTFTYNKGSIAGNEASYKDDNYGNEREFNTVSEFYIRGKLFNYFDLDMTLSRNRFSPTERNLNFRYDHRGVRAEYGNIALSVTGNELVSFSKRVTGLSAEIPLFGGRAKFVKSKARSRAKTRTLRGNNTSGPYYLGYFPIEDGSERVRIDNNDISSDQYQIDYETGILYFREDMIIPETSEIEVVFEVRVTSRMEGEITGLRVWQPIGDRAVIGYTRLTQDTGGGGDSEEIPRTDVIPGDGTGGPYQLYYGPIVPGSDEVRIEGEVQIRDEDYTIDYNLGFLYFFYAVGVEQNIVVSYKQLVESALAANRTVTGYDIAYQLNPDMALWWSYGKSNADAEGRPGGGSASILRGNFNFYRSGEGGRRVPLAVLDAQTKDIEDGFATIENASFRRNEKGNSANLVLTPWDYVKVLVTRDRVKRPAGVSSIAGQSTTSLSFGNTLYSVDLAFPKWPAVTVSRTTTTNRDLSPDPTVSTSLTSDVVNWRYSRGKLDLSGGRTTQDNRNEIADEYASQAATSRMSAGYRAGESFSVSADYSTSSIKASTGADTTARTRRYGVAYRPFATLSLSADFSSQTSGGTVAPSQQPVDGALDGSSGSEQTSRRYSLTWAPGSRLSINLNFYKSLQNAAYTSNSDHTSSALTASWRHSEKLQTGVTLTKQSVQYLGEQGGMDVRSVSFWASVGPYKKFTADLAASAFDTKSDIQFGTGSPFNQPQSQESTIRDLNLTIRRPLSERSDAFLRWELSERDGFGSFNKAVSEVGIDHRFNDVTTLTINGSVTIYHDLFDPGYDYTARLVTARLDLRF